MRHIGLTLLVAVALVGSGCGDDRLTHAAMGILKVNVLNAGATASKVELTLRCTTDSRDEAAQVDNPTLIKVDDLAPGACQARVVTRAPTNAILRSIWVSDLSITAGKTTEITVDMADQVLPPEVKELCNGWDDNGDGLVDKPKEFLLLCSECVRELESPSVDDPRCAPIRCDEYLSYELRGNAANGWTCVKRYQQDITDKRCAGLGKCLEQSEATCQQHSSTMEDVVATVEPTDVCRKVDGCSGKTAPVVVALPDGTDCGASKACKAGECVCKPDCTGRVCGDDGCGGSCGACGLGESCSAAGQCDCQPACSGKACGDDGCGGSCGACAANETCSAAQQCEPLAPETGCADGTREGFLSLTDYPSIASCSGGWTVGGVTRADLLATCGRQAGNSGQNKEGTGCSSADLCASGWHVCNGKTEVAAKTGAKGCQESVPSGSPDKAMFFAVAQHSDANTVCDDLATGDNDVFGCGNLGVQLAADKACGVLTRALASMTPQSCGYTEAEPTLGPWECKGDATSHLHEGRLVTKKGCASQSCTWESAPTGNWDRGGVLCCKD